MTGILEAIVAIGTIVSAIYGIYKLAAWQLTKTPEEKKEEIDKETRDEKDEVQKTGRPKWD